MTELQQKLREKIRELEQIRKIKEHTAELTQRLAAEQKSLFEMEKVLSKEQRDVELLEREGLTTMFRKFLGDREERLEKEREDYLRASLRFNELYKSVEIIRFELDLLIKKEQTQEAVERSIESLITLREEELLRLDPAAAAALKSIIDQFDKLTKYGVEIDEAFAAGTEALSFVSKAEKFLHKAQMLGQRQMWGGRQQLSTHSKFEALDHARNNAYESRHALIRFGNELKDVYKDYPFQFNMDLEDFSKFVNVFFENLITDFLVQQKISKSLVNVTGTRQNVEAILHELEKEKSIIQGKEQALELERKRLVISV